MSTRARVRVSSRAVVMAALAVVLVSDTAPASPTPGVAPTPAPPAVVAPARAPTVDPELARLDSEARAPATDVRLAPSSRGVLGAWLVAGPFRAGRPALDAAPTSVDERKLTAPTSGAIASGERDLGGPGAKKKPPAHWTVTSSSDGPVDLKAAFEQPGNDLIAFAAGTLHLERAGRVLVMLGVDDGVKLSVDGTVAFQRDDPRPVREDDDVVPLDLAAGEHNLLLKFHQRDGAWAFRVRVVDAATLEPPAGMFLALPGTSADDARVLAAKMAFVSLDRSFDGASSPARYRPKLTVRYSEGAPRGVPLAVSARLANASAASEEPLFDVRAGGVPVAASGVSELVASLPPVTPSENALSLETTVAGRTVKHPLPSRPLAEQAVARATRALAKTAPSAPFLTSGAYDSVTYLTRRLSALLGRGDGDVEAQNDEARELDRLADALERGVDPFEGRTGPMRRALRDPLDGDYSELGVYVPPGFKEGATRKFPLVVGLHGLNGYAMGVLRWLFGGDDPKHDQLWEDRHVGTLPPFAGFVITPLAHGNSLYRELGEVDVMNAVAWAMQRYPIDPARVTITGMSMGGIGAAAVPLHHPERFAAAAPLCGYHSYFIRSDIGARSMRPWERFLAEERSNVFWAENGEHLPLWIVHGTQDLPEENSGVLIERYEKLNFSVKHDHPEAGHNVWQQTYEENKGLDWLAAHRLDLHPSHVRFKTTRTRYATSAWVAIDELASESGWGEIDARARSKSKTITASTSGISQVTFTRDEQLLGDAPVTVVIDGQTLSFADNEPLVAGRTGTAWTKGALIHNTLWKHAAVTGPIRDVFDEPVLFVYGGAEEASANEEVARSFAKIRGGVSVAYPIMSDAEFFARGEPVANDRALFLIGRKNKVLDAIERSATETRSAWPIHVEPGAVQIGRERFTGKELGAAFIRPNPARPDRYVVVMAGADAAGMLRAMSLPDLLPDFVVWDDAVAPARGQLLLGAGKLRAGGFFDKTWALPARTADPLTSGH